MSRRRTVAAGRLAQGNSFFFGPVWTILRSSAPRSRPRTPRHPAARQPVRDLPFLRPARLHGRPTPARSPKNLGTRSNIDATAATRLHRIEIAPRGWRGARRAGLDPRRGGRNRRPRPAEKASPLDPARRSRRRAPGPGAGPRPRAHGAAAATRISAAAFAPRRLEAPRAASARRERAHRQRRRRVERLSRFGYRARSRSRC